MKLFGKSEKSAARDSDLPIIAIRDLVIFPQSAAPVYIQKPAAIKSIEAAMSGKRQVILAYYSGDENSLKLENLNEIATVARVVQVMKLPNNSSRILLEGLERISLSTVSEQDGYFTGKGDPLRLYNSLNEGVSTRMRALQESFRGFARENKKVPKEILSNIERSDNPHALIDQILSQLNSGYRDKLRFLNQVNTLERLDDLAIELESEKQVQNLKKDISKRVKQRMDENHREFVINEQIRELNKELGKEEDDPSGTRELEESFQNKKLPAEIQSRVDTELKRLKRLQPISPEAGILRGYLEWIADLPWDETSEDRLDIDEATNILNEDHYAMDEPKERILDFLAVLQMKNSLKGPILCFVGPPGTGKTSLGKSLARAMGRSFVRISLGGVRDEAEIRGHRRTYVGALPGKIIQALKKAGTANPVILLDEIDKLSSDHRGDPSSALLEVLDPEQNVNFVDHYMEIPVDLSKVLFVTTANSLHGIPYPLLDRMEIIQIPGYTRIEKLKIADGFIIPKQLTAHGLEWADVKFSPDAMKAIIDGYTRESGVRNLERVIARAVRKIARKAVEEGKIPPLPEIPEPPEAESSSDILESQDVLQNTEPLTVLENAIEGGIDGTGEPSVTAIETDTETADTVQTADTPDSPETVSEIAPSDTGADAATALEGDAATLYDDTPSIEMPEFKFHVGIKHLEKLLGTRKFDIDLLYQETPPGLVYGMAWTELGGKLLPVEAIILKSEGNGEMTLTGSLGDVMKESARIALSLVRKLAEDDSLPMTDVLIQNADIHIHVPEGAIPKDGPSAGITLTTALLSIFTDKPVREFTAMTGEITLTGRVLPVGGIKEKVLAAHRNGFKHIILPAKNRKDHDELPAEVRKAIQFDFVQDIHEAIPLIFGES